MSSRVEDLRSLAEMLDEGKISEQEYEIVKAEIIAAPADEWDQPGPAATLDVAAADAATAEEPQVPAAGLVEPETDDRDGGDERGWRALLTATPRTYWTAAAGALAVILAFALLGGDSTGQVRVTPAQAASVESQVEAPVGSLGVEFEDLAEQWNALDRPPYVLKGMTITPESGPLDGFLYRFDNAALLTGAYNPGDGHVYAVMVKAGLRHESISNFYVHLCYLLHPGSQECLEAFVEEAGVYGAAISDFEGVTHEASWRFEANEWRVTVEEDVETIRVIGPQQQG